MESALEASDHGALDSEQLERLRLFKIRTRIANETYLRSHQELPLLLAGFLREVMLKRPENIREFAAEHFTDPELPSKIQSKLAEKEGRPCSP
ncbi:RIIa domain-containing protein 1 [Ambystoma mexicanum]|uniref:RIIa domain-containing protein 1 n=1 Tax=Ambystoma mexicanum TaxID=8296 RepID=UPI0037E96871